MSGPDHPEALRPEQLRGTWRLERWEAIDEAGEVDEPYGPDPLGYVVYTTDGLMITTVSQRGRGASEAVAETDPTTPSSGSTSSFVAYSGPFHLDGGDVIHTVEMSTIAAWVGTEQRRHVELSDDGRTVWLSTDPRMIGERRVRHRLRWRRVEG